MPFTACAGASTASVAPLDTPPASASAQPAIRLACEKRFCTRCRLHCTVCEATVCDAHLRMHGDTCVCARRAVVKEANILNVDVVSVVMSFLYPNDHAKPAANLCSADP
jgi:hypothetical protein